MTTLHFENLMFALTDDELSIRFMKVFRCAIPMDEVKKAGLEKVEKHAITLSSPKRFDFLLANAFKNLVNTVNSKPAMYIHRGSGIPLIGNRTFGIIDRGSSLVEVKPMSGCNVECIYCSVNQDSRSNDFVVEADYLVEEFEKLAAFKDCPLEAHIGTQGEPLLYSDLVRLVRGLSSVPQVKTISMDTSAIMLSIKLIDELVEAGMDQFNISLNAVDKKIADRMAGIPYPVDHVMKMCRHIASKADITLAPVLLQGHNEDQIAKIVRFAKTLPQTHTVRVGVQNFLSYRFGRNPAKEIAWEEFYAFLKKLEKQEDMKLVWDAADFHISKTKPLPKPFKKGELVEAQIVCPGRMQGEMIAVAKDRTISIPDCTAKKGMVKVSIQSAKHNLFLGKI
ncbi:MAG: radical SAM protein [Nanoarchaeota archaeon]